jgi:uncharacterized membrane protein
MAAGALIRHSFVVRHKALAQGRRVPWEYAAGGCALLLGLAVWLAPAPLPPAAAQDARSDSAPVSFAQVQAVMEARCTACHNGQVQQKNVALHTPELLQRQAQAVYQQTVVLKLMPLNNATGITEAERQLLRRWFEAGAPGP